MSWNYRVLRQTMPDGAFYFGIHEVFYDDDGAIEGWTAEAVAIGGDTYGELTRDSANYQRAFARHVIADVDGVLYDIGPMGTKADDTSRVLYKRAQERSPRGPAPKRNSVRAVTR